jgi:GTP cyclohydrolase IA
MVRKQVEVTSRDEKTKNKGIETPMHDHAFDLSDEEKIEQISTHFQSIMEILGLDLEDDSLKDTPNRVAKMYVEEIFCGLNPKNKPTVSVFDNTYQYEDVLIEKDILVQSCCEHHFLPFTGKAHVAYIPSDKVVGLSKINRVVDYYSRRPQVQERLTLQIADDLKKVLKTDDVAVYIESKHMCVAMRGIKDDSSTTITSTFHGKLKKKEFKQQFLRMIGQ